MTVDISRIRGGDEVLVKATFSRQLGVVVGACSYVTISENCQGYISNSAIVSHTPKPLVVGDKVWGLTSKRDGKVLHVIGDLAWVEFEDGEHEIVLPEQVDRVS